MKNTIVCLYVWLSDNFSIDYILRTIQPLDELLTWVLVLEMPYSYSSDDYKFGS